MLILPTHTYAVGQQSARLVQIAHRAYGAGEIGKLDDAGVVLHGGPGQVAVRQAGWLPGVGRTPGRRAASA